MNAKKNAAAHGPIFLIFFIFSCFYSFFFLFFFPGFSQSTSGASIDRDVDLYELEARFAGSSGSERISILQQLTQGYSEKDLGKALYFGKEALKLMRRSAESAESAESAGAAGSVSIAEHLIRLSSIAYRHGRYNAVLLYANEAVMVCEQMNLRDKLAYALRMKAMGHKYLAEYDQSIPLLRRALAIHEELADRRGEAICLNAIGLIYRRLNDYAKALDFILKAGEIFEQLNDAINRSMVLNNVGLIYLNMDDADTALKYFIRSRDIDAAQNNLQGLSIVEGNIAEIYQQQGKYEEALHLLQKSLAYSLQTGQNKRVGNTLISIGLHYKLRKNYKTAARYFKQAQKIKIEINEYFGIADATFQLGAVYREMGLLDHARTQLEQALKTARRIKAPQFELAAHKELAALLELKGEFQNALAHYKLFNQLDDSMFNQQNSNRMAQLQTRLDMELKEKEISLLKKDGQIRTLQLKRSRSLKNWLFLVSILVAVIAFVTYTRYQLKVRVSLVLQESEEKYKALAENLAETVEERTEKLREAQQELLRKERLTVLGQLTATVAHEIRTPLAAVRSSVFSIEMAMSNNKPERIQQALNLADRNIVRCDRIVDDLLNFTRRRELKPELTDVDQWLQKLLSEYSIPPDMQLNCSFNTAADLLIDQDRLRRAVINVLNNAVAAVQQAACPTLSVTTEIKDQRLNMSFQDNGSGISDDICDKIFEPLFSTKHFGFGLGLPVVRNIMTEHFGGVQVNSQPEHGTVITLWLPLPQV